MPDPQSDVQPGTQEVRDIRGAAADTIQQYYLYRPANEDGQAPWPILLFLHGRGEGRHNKKQVYQGIGAVTNHGAPPVWNLNGDILSLSFPLSYLHTSADGMKYNGVKRSNRFLTT